MITALSLLLILLAGITVLTAEFGWSNLTLVKRNEVVFENKNQKYGAYSLRAAYNDHMLIALGIMLLIVMAFFSGNLIWKNIFREAKLTTIPPDSHVIVDLPYTIQEVPQTPIEPIKAKSPLAAVTDQFTTPQVVTTTVATAPKPQDLLNGPIGSTPGNVPAGGGSPDPTTNTGSLLPTTDVVDFADVNPSFPNGEAALNAYLSSNIKYPEQEHDLGVQGVVYLSFVVSTTGEITSVSEVRGVKGGPNLSREAMRVIRNMPRWTPGKLRGELVNVRFTLPVRFKIR